MTDAEEILDEETTETPETTVTPAETDATLAAVKGALCLTTDIYDDELADLIAAARFDLKIAGVTAYDAEDDPLVTQAVKTYVRCHFKSPDDYDRLAAAYDAQKGALQIATGYTNWGEGE